MTIDQVGSTPAFTTKLFYDSQHGHPLGEATDLAVGSESTCFSGIMSRRFFIAENDPTYFFKTPTNTLGESILEMKLTLYFNEFWRITVSLRAVTFGSIQVGGWTHDYIWSAQAHYISEESGCMLWDAVTFTKTEEKSLQELETTDPDPPPTVDPEYTFPVTIDVQHVYENGFNALDPFLYFQAGEF